MATGETPAAATGEAHELVGLDAEAADLSRQYALGDCIGAWMETSYLARVVAGWVVVIISLISMITSLTPADWDPGLVGLGLIALPFGGLMIWLRPRSRGVRLYLFEGGTARASNAWPGPRLVVLPWADLKKVTPRFDSDGDLIGCDLRGHSGTRLVLGKYDGFAAPQAITHAAERVLAGRSPGV